MYPYETRQGNTEEEVQTEDITFNEENIISKATKCLGMSFNPSKDELHFSNYKNIIQEKQPLNTKRGISKIIPSIYDPNGLLQPFILKGKLILKKTWKYTKPNGEKLSWDEDLPLEIQKEFEKWMREVPEVSDFQTNRYLFQKMKRTPKNEDIYLHAFSDGGDNAYGSCVYVRYYNTNTKLYNSQIIYSASRVAPNKTHLSIPKKELNGILLACEKAKYVSEVLDIPTKNIFIHTASLVALHWIQNK